MITPVTIVITNVNTGLPIHSFTKPNNSIAQTVKDAIVNGISLNYADFTNADLKGVSFSHVKMKGVNFTGADLTNARFYKSRMMYVTFKHTNLSEANLEQATIKYSGIHDVNFTDVFAKNIHIIDCVTSNWNLTNAVMRGAGLVRNRAIPGSKDIYDNTDLRGSFARQDPILHAQKTLAPTFPGRYRIPAVTNIMLKEQGYKHLDQNWKVSNIQHKNTILFGHYLDTKQNHPEASDKFAGIDQLFCNIQEAFCHSYNLFAINRGFKEIAKRLVRIDEHLSFLIDSNQF
jgi:uncharacterized protein YjbI with pentapeptide repeats